MKSEIIFKYAGEKTETNKLFKFYTYQIRPGSLSKEIIEKLLKNGKSG